MDAQATYAPVGIRARARSEARARGAGAVAASALTWGLGYALGLPRSFIATSRGEFTFAGERYPYLHHRHNWTWLNERAVEVPIARRAVERNAGRRVLEVGNVLSHYQEISHSVVDKYERAPGIVNTDVLDIATDEPFDLVVTVSTLEHVGWDEEPRDPERVLAAVDHLTSLLASGGQLLITWPAGYNPLLDASVRDGRLQFDDVRGLRRNGSSLDWEEVSVDDALSTPYDKLLYTAGAIVVASRRV